MYKFNLSQAVFVKPFDREGIITGQHVSFIKGQSTQITYEVAMNTPVWEDYYGGISEYIGKRYQYVRIHESDLVRIEESPAPTLNAAELKPWKKVDLNPTCECGKEKHGFASHSTWCPKHD